MAWESLSSRLSSLPLVLAGPIVRKTTETSVSVWIALKEAQSLELVIKSNPGLNDIRSGSANTKSFGKNLHVALITVSGLSLQPNTIYHYDIKFSGSRTLSTQGILGSSGGVSKIVYGGHFLPSFMLPSDDMSKLKILHCSCRKPHGGVAGTMGKDFFEAVSNLLKDTHNMANERPQQLYLTGDQIYADDVSDLLLFMLRDAENNLLGWGSDNRELLPSNPTPSVLSPLHRLPLITSAGFTSGKVANSHLLRLGEFYSMYLFVWSTELWPDDSDFPSYADYTSYADDPNLNLSGEATEAKYNAKKSVLIDFKRSVEYVRTLLANISTYMIFDDHEITDDWNLNKPWVDKVYSSADGLRIIQNGLSAYAVFQGWGNKPEIFSNTTSNENFLLYSLVTLNQHGVAGASQDNDWGIIGAKVIPVKSGNELTGGIDWSYSLSFDKFNVIVLNSRTNRALSEGFPSLLSNTAIQSQISDRFPEKLPQHDFTLIIAPAPVFGLPLMEDLIQPIVAKYKGAPKGDYEPWSADRNKFEHSLREIAAFRRILILSGDVHYAFSNSVDYWNKRTGTEVRSKFVNLTCSSLKNSSAGAPDGTTFLADVINNHIPEILLNIKHDGLYVGWNTANNLGSEYIITEERDLVLGETVPINTIQGKISINRGSGIGIAHWHHLIPYTSKYPPAKVPVSKRKAEIRQWVNPLFPPDWQYNIVFESDFRNEEERTAGTMPTLSTGAGTIGIATKHAALATARGDHTIVGSNNIGEITFQWGSSENDKRVIHKIWSKVGNNIIPLTIHLVDFGIADATDQKPSEIGRVQ